MGMPFQVLVVFTLCTLWSCTDEVEKKRKEAPLQVDEQPVEDDDPKLESADAQNGEEIQYDIELSAKNLELQNSKPLFTWKDIGASKYMVKVCKSSDCESSTQEFEVAKPSLQLSALQTGSYLLTVSAFDNVGPLSLVNTSQEFEVFSGLRKIEYSGEIFPQNYLDQSGVLAGPNYYMLTYQYPSMSIEMWQFNLNEKIWKKLTPPPTSFNQTSLILSGNLVWADNNLYYYLGAKTYKFNSGTNIFEEVAFESDFKTKFAQVKFVPIEIGAIGCGIASSGGEATCFRMDTKNNSYKLLPEFKPGKTLYDFSLVYESGKVYFLDGILNWQESKNSEKNHTLYSYDVNTHKLEKLTDAIKLKGGVDSIFVDKDGVSFWGHSQYRFSRTKKNSFYSSKFGSRFLFYTTHDVSYTQSIEPSVEFSLLQNKLIEKGGNQIETARAEIFRQGKGSIVFAADPEMVTITKPVNWSTSYGNVGYKASFSTVKKPIIYEFYK